MRVLKLIALVIWIGACMGLAWILQKCKKFIWRDAVARVCHRGILFILGIRVTIHGQVSSVRPLMLVSNHLSYLDIHVLGSAFPFRFTPKSEIASWPFIGSLCRISECIFVERAPHKFRQAMRDIGQMISRGKVVCVFPEATTGNGIHMLPFKSGLFQLADAPVGGNELQVQPAAIAYTHVRGLPIDSAQWPQIAWYGDMKLLPHLWEFLKLGKVHVKLQFLPTTTMKEQGDRKQLAEHCQAVIDEAIYTARIQAREMLQPGY